MSFDLGAVRRLRVIASWVVAAGALSVAAGCGDDDSSSDDGSSGGGGDYVQELQDRVDGFMGNGTYTDPPSSAPEPKDGASVTIIGCGDVIPVCAQAAGAAEEASKLVGWDATTFDPKGDPTAAGEGIRRAISTNADAILLHYIDCEFIQGPLREAKEAGIVVVAAESYDCDTPGVDAEPLFTAEIEYVPGEGTTAYYDALITAYAEYTIAALDGAANTLWISDNVTTGSRIATETIEGVYEECADCELTTELVPYGSFGTDLQSRVEQKLVQNPEINSVLPAYSDVALGGTTAGARASGRDLVVGVGDGANEAVTDLVREGQATFGMGADYEWEGYAMVDTAIRLLAGEEPANSGIGTALFDAEEGLPDAGPWQPDIDYVSAYSKAWGVEG